MKYRLIRGDDEHVVVEITLSRAQAAQANGWDNIAVDAARSLAVYAHRWPEVRARARALRQQ